MRKSQLRVPALVLVGSLLMQLAWILVLPSFRGIDEFDHVYRAAAVGHGEWIAEPSEATRGTGAIVTVPRATVKAASPVCESLPYTETTDCNPHDEASAEMTTVASGAGRYNPLFYAAVGYPTRFLDGYASLYGMRILTAVLSSLLFALASLALSIWSRSHWPLAGLLVAWTPVAVYSTAVVAPNGPEMAAGALVWCAVLGSAQWQLTPRQVRTLVLLATIGAIVLVMLRSLGPLWLALIVGSCVLLGWGQFFENLRRQRRLVIGVGTTVGVATLASLWWILQMRSLTIGKPAEVPGDPLTETLKAIFVWLFQSIAAFPRRGEPAPLIVYVCCLFAGAMYLGFSFVRANERARTTMLAVLGTSIVLPAVISVITYSSYGTAWQGRYALPFSIGFVLIAGSALDKHPLPRRRATPIVLAAAMIMTVAHSVGVLNVLANESIESALAGTPAWTPPAAWAVGTLVVLGWVCWSFAVRAVSPRECVMEKVEVEHAEEAA